MKTRLAHFFWLGKIDGEVRDFKYQEFASVHSFLVHHRDWSVTLWTNSNFSGKLFDHCISLGLHVERIERVPNQINLSAEVDYHKWHVLYKLGGMILDISDTVTVANFDPLYDTASKLLWSHYTIGVKQMGNGWLCIDHAGSEIARLMNEAISYTNKVQPVSWWESKSFQLSKQVKDCSRHPTDQKIVFGGSFTHHWKMIQENVLDIPIQCKQMHFYYGNVLVGDLQIKKRIYLDKYYADMPNWRQQTNIITQSYAIAMERAGINGVPVLDGSDPTIVAPPLKTVALTEPVKKYLFGDGSIVIIGKDGRPLEGYYE